jgi:hypothetical protein
MNKQTMNSHANSCQSISTTKSKEQDSKNMNSFQPIKILKRQPNSEPCLTAMANSANPPKPIKTLEEREAAYAEARLRILGPQNLSSDADGKNDAPSIDSSRKVNSSISCGNEKGTFKLANSYNVNGNATNCSVNFSEKR